MNRIANININKLLERKNLQQFYQIIKYSELAIAAALIIIISINAVERWLDTEGLISTIKLQVKSNLQSAANSNLEVKPTRDYSLLAKHSIFGEMKAVEVSNPTTPQVSNATLILLGTFIASGEEPYAIIADKSNNEQEIFNIEDAIFSVAKLVKIEADRVEIERNGTKEVLILEEDFSGAPSTGSGSTAASGQVVKVSETEIDQALENLPLLLTQARAVPYFKDGQSIGLRLFAIKKDSLFEKIGLKNGDILKTINGNSLGDITQAVKLFEKLKEEKSIGLSLQRGSEELDFKYQIG